MILVLPDFLQVSLQVGISRQVLLAFGHLGVTHAPPGGIAVGHGLGQDKVSALDLGADDYLTKPFGTDELLARVRTAIRHTRTATGNSEIAQQGTYTVGDLTIDYNKHQVLVRGENAKLTLSEFRIVALLGKHAGRVMTYDSIIKELWGPRASGDNQILRVNMANIRRKIEKNPAEPEYLFTEVGVGYRMAESEN